MYDRDRVNQFAMNSAVLVPGPEFEAIRIDVVDDEEGIIYGEGEETGEEYAIYYSEIDLDETMWYRLVPLTANDLKNM